MRKLLSLMLIIFLLSFVSSQNVTLNYPSEVETNQEFSLGVLLSEFNSSDYDIKIDILNDNETRIAKILNNGEWKSTYYYVNNAFSNSEEEEFQLKIENYIGISNIIIKIRISGTSTLVGTFDGYTIESLQAQESTTSPPTETASTQQSPSLTDTNNDETPNHPVIANASQQSSRENEETAEAKKPITSEVVYLNPKTKDIKTNNNVLTSDNIAIYGLFGFCILLGILFMARKIKKPKTEFKD